MKKIIYLLVITAMVIVSCVSKVKTVPVDLEAEKVAVNELFDNFNAAYLAGDAATLTSFLTEDALFLGTDPGEFWDKNYFRDVWTETFTSGVPELHEISGRTIKLAPDGQSCIMIQQYIMPEFLPGIIMRNAYSLTKTDGDWKIFVINVSIIPKNEDIPKIIGALN